jgi:hypothetical protein
MPAGASCISTLRSIQQAIESYSNFAKHSHCLGLTDTFLFDHDSKFGDEVLQFLHSSALKPMRTSIRSPWQNGVAERWVGSARRELLDHVIPLNEYHVRWLSRDYLAYYPSRPNTHWPEQEHSRRTNRRKSFSVSNPNRVRFPVGRSSPSLPLDGSSVKFAQCDF